MSSCGFSATTATVQMLKLHTVRTLIFTSVTQNHGDSQKITAHDQNHGKSRSDRAYLNATDWRTDSHSQTTYCRITALCVASRGKSQGEEGAAAAAAAGAGGKRRRRRRYFFAFSVAWELWGAYIRRLYDVTWTISHDACVEERWNLQVPYNDDRISPRYLINADRETSLWRHEAWPAAEVDLHESYCKSDNLDSFFRRALQRCPISDYARKEVDMDKLHKNYPSYELLIDASSKSVSKIATRL